MRYVSGASLDTARPIGAETCNALITEAPLSTAELHALKDHFAALHTACVISGPRFTNATRDSTDMHNRAVRRLRGIRDEAKRRAALQEDDDLMDIA